MPPKEQRPPRRLHIGIFWKLHFITFSRWTLFSTESARAGDHFILQRSVEPIRIKTRLFEHSDEPRVPRGCSPPGDITPCAMCRVPCSNASFASLANNYIFSTATLILASLLALSMPSVKALGKIIQKVEKLTTTRTQCQNLVSSFNCLLSVIAISFPFYDLIRTRKT
jgi:hypothetical protein